MLSLFVSCDNSSNNSNSTNSNETFKKPSEVRKELRFENNGIYNLNVGCGYDNIPNIDFINFYPATERQNQQIASIMQYSGLPSNFSLISAPNINNAYAFVNDYTRYILFDTNFLNTADNNSSNYWASMSILAHEIGHHLSNHTLSGVGSNIPHELQADKYSGFMLYKMGATLEQAQIAINRLGTDYATQTHPSKNDRLNAIESGWNEAYELQFKVAIPPIPSDDEYFENTEFVKENMLDVLQLGEYYHESDLMEGIVLRSNHDEGYAEVKQTDDSGFDFMNYRSDGAIPISIIIDDSPTEYLGINSTKNIYHLLVPGRRIKFKVIVEANGRHAYFSYIAHNKFRVMSNKTNENSKESLKTFVVVAEKAYFHNEPNKDSIRKAYLAQDDSGQYIKEDGDFLYIIFTNSKNKTSKGWISKSDVAWFEPSQ